MNPRIKDVRNAVKVKDLTVEYKSFLSDLVKNDIFSPREMRIFIATCIKCLPDTEVARTLKNNRTGEIGVVPSTLLAGRLEIERRLKLLNREIEEALRESFRLSKAAAYAKRRKRLFDITSDVVNRAGQYKRCKEERLRPMFDAQVIKKSARNKIASLMEM